MNHPLQASLDYSNKMVSSRMRRNHVVKPVMNKSDLLTINKVGRIMDIRNTITKIKTHGKQKSKDIKGACK